MRLPSSQISSSNAEGNLGRISPKVVDKKVCVLASKVEIRVLTDCEQDLHFFRTKTRITAQRDDPMTRSPTEEESRQ
jgi:hypothetical protein